jgi:2-keto-4-pentenoate hydratase
MTPVSYIQFIEYFRPRALLAPPSSGDVGLSSNDATLSDSSARAASIAEQFVRARLRAAALSAYPGLVPGDLSAAYACQDAAIDRWPEPLAGWKVARIPPEWQGAFPEERLIGPVFRRNVRIAQSGETLECPVFAGGLSAVEAEIVIRIGADAPPRKVGWSLDEALALIADVHIGVEVASSPLATLNDLGSGAVISDFGNNWGVVVGPSIGDWRSLEEIPAETRIDDQVVGRGKAIMRPGPFGALLFTLKKCALRGRPLKKGDVISTGMITGVHEIGLGQISSHSFEGFGEVRCCIVRAQPLTGLTV